MATFIFPPIGGGGGANLVLENPFVHGDVTVGTTPVEARVGSANLPDRKMLLIQNKDTTTVFFGGASVTATNGIAIKSEQTLTINLSPNVTPYLVTQSGTANCVVAEFA